MQTDFDLALIIEITSKALGYKSEDIRIERVVGGVSTNVYKLITTSRTYYFRIASDENENLDPEVTVHKLLLEKRVKVPIVEYYENFNPQIGRSFMIISEIKGKTLRFESGEHVKKCLIEAGMDLAKINSIKVDGFDWIERSGSDIKGLKGHEPTYKSFLLHELNTNLDTLCKKTLLTDEEVLDVNTIVDRFIDKIANLNSYLAHGDYDIAHLFSLDGEYTGVIDFGDIRGADIFFDLAHFKATSDQLFTCLLEGYSRVVNLPGDYELRVAMPKLLFSIKKFMWVVSNLSYTDEQLKGHVLLKSIKKELVYFKNL